MSFLFYLTISKYIRCICVRVVSSSIKWRGLIASTQLSDSQQWTALTLSTSHMLITDEFLVSGAVCPMNHR